MEREVDTGLTGSSPIPRLKQVTSVNPMNFLGSLLALSYKVPSVNTKDKSSFIEGLHRLYPDKDLEDIVATHQAMTGGKWAFLPEPARNPRASFGTQDDESRPTKIVWFPPPSRSLSITSPMTIAYQFFQECPDLLGRPATHEELFWVAYVSWVKAFRNVKDKHLNPNYKVCIMECRSFPVFRMFMDMDFTELVAMTPQSWTTFCKKVVSITAKTLTTFFPSLDKNAEEFRVTILETSRFTEKSKGGGFKRGIHLVWPSLYVDKTMALHLLTCIELALTKSGPKRDPTAGQNSYVQALDPSVYNSGLRMPACPKSMPCPTCGKDRAKKLFHKTENKPSNLWANENRDFCPEHQRPWGFMFVPNTEYNICAIFNGLGKPLPRAEFLELTTQRYVVPGGYDFTLKELTSIRTNKTEVTPGFVGNEVVYQSLQRIGPNDPRLAPHKFHDPEAETEGRPTKRMCLRLTVSQNEIKRQCYATSHAITLNASLVAKAVTYVRKLSNQYKDVVLERPTAQPSSRELTLSDGRKVLHRSVTFRSDTFFCLKKGAAHTSNGVTFMFVYTGEVKQGCWSSNIHNGRVCKKFWSDAVKAIVRVKPDDLDFLYELLNTPFAT